MFTQKKGLTFNVPTREEVSPANQAIFDHMKGAFGKVPNLYATFALHDNALEDYLSLQNRKSTLDSKEKEIINLVVSQINDCKYCTAAHTAVGKMYGFTDEQILDIRKVKIAFNKKYNALAQFVKETTITRGHASEEALKVLFDSGYTTKSLIDIFIMIGDKTISNYLHNTTKIPLDWDAVPSI